MEQGTSAWSGDSGSRKWVGERRGGASHRPSKEKHEFSECKDSKKFGFDLEEAATRHSMPATFADLGMRGPYRKSDATKIFVESRIWC
jgi:hypothetical protein